MKKLIILLLTACSALAQPGPPGPTGKGVQQFGFHNANGFVGTVASPTTNPVLTLNNTLMVPNTRRINGFTLDADITLPALPAGGLMGYVLSKASGSDYDVQWSLVPSSGGGATIENTVNLIKGDNAGNGLNSGLLLSIPSPTPGFTLTAGGKTLTVPLSDAQVNGAISSRGKQEDVWFSVRTDGQTGTGVEADPYDSTGDLYTPWQAHIVSPSPIPRVVHLVNKTGVAKFVTTRHLFTPPGIVIEGNNSTIQADPTFWGADQPSNPAIDGEQGIIGDSNNTANGLASHVTYRNLIVDCNNNNQTPPGAWSGDGARVNGIWARGDGNVYENVHIIHSGNTYHSHVDASEGEQFIVNAGNYTIFNGLTIDTFDNYTHGTITMIANVPGSNDVAGDDSPSYGQSGKGIILGPITSSHAGGFIAGVNLQACNYCDYQLTAKEWNINGGAVVYDDTGSTTGCRIHDSIFNHIYSTSGGGATGIDMAQGCEVEPGGRLADWTNTKLEIDHNTFILGVAGSAISITKPNHIVGASCVGSNTASNGNIDGQIHDNHVYLYANGRGTLDPSYSFGILGKNFLRGKIENNWFGPGAVAGGQAWQLSYSNGTELTGNHAPSDLDQPFTNTALIKHGNRDLSGHLLDTNLDPPSPVANLPASPQEGMWLPVTDGNIQGGVVNSGGSHHIPVYFNGSNWSAPFLVADGWSSDGTILSVSRGDLRLKGTVGDFGIIMQGIGAFTSQDATVSFAATPGATPRVTVGGNLNVGQDFAITASPAPSSDGQVLTWNAANQNWEPRVSGALTSVLQNKVARVEIGGNDTTGAVGDGSLPFATIGTANSAAITAGGTVAIVLGVGAWSETVQLGDNVSLIGRGKKLSVINGSTGLTNPTIQPGNNSLIADLSATSSGSSPIGAGSASNASTGVIIQDCAFTGGSDCIYFNRAGLGTWKAYNSFFGSTFDTLYANASGLIFIATNCEFNTNGATGINNRNLGVTAGTVTVQNSRLVNTKAGGPNTSAVTQGGTINLSNIVTTRVTGGGAFDLQNISGTLNAVSVVRDDGAPLSNSGVVTMKAQTSITTFANLNASPTEGDEANINDGKTANCGDGTCTTFGATVTGGGGAIHLKVRYNGTNWTISAL